MAKRHVAKEREPVDNPDNLPPETLKESHDTSTVKDDIAEFCSVRERYISMLRMRLFKLAGTKLKTAEERKRLADEINQFRRELNLSFAFMNDGNREKVMLGCPNGSFQLKSTSTKKHVHSSTAFPELEVF